MIIVKVTYTVKEGFAAENQENIKLFLDDFKRMESSDFSYKVYLCQDGKTFVHLSHHQNEEIQKQVLAVESFLSFQRKRDESGLETQPEIEVMRLVGSTHEIFN